MAGVPARLLQDLVSSSSNVGFVGICGHLLHLGQLLYPERSPRSIRHRALLASLAISQFRTIQEWYATVPGNPKLVAALERFPEIQGAIYWPYIHSRWPLARRLEAVATHYRSLDGQAKVLNCAVHTDVELSNLEEEYPGLRLVLDKAMWFVREGEVVLNLFVGNQRLFSVAFSLGSEDGKRVAYVGALQGSNVREVWPVYREITKALHRMRPRDLLLAALRLLCRQLGVSKIYAVSNSSRHHHGVYFGGCHAEKLLLNYDEVWTEHGGVRMDNGFFEISTTPVGRKMSEIPTRKRATYRRRYRMLDGLADDVARSCRQHETLN